MVYLKVDDVSPFDKLRMKYNDIILAYGESQWRLAFTHYKADLEALLPYIIDAYNINEDIGNFDHYLRGEVAFGVDVYRFSDSDKFSLITQSIEFLSELTEPLHFCFVMYSNIELYKKDHQLIKEKFIDQLDRMSRKASSRDIVAKNKDQYDQMMRTVENLQTDVDNEVMKQNILSIIHQNRFLHVNNWLSNVTSYNTIQSKASIQDSSLIWHTINRLADAVAKLQSRRLTLGAPVPDALTGVDKQAADVVERRFARTYGEEYPSYVAQGLRP